jgi:activator of HSP90 ATPase
MFLIILWARGSMQRMNLRNRLTSRRQLIVGAYVAVAGRAWAGDGDAVSHTAESIHQEPVFKASPKRVYEALTDTKQFAKVVQLSGAMQSMSLGNKPTEISKQTGGAFTLFGGHIFGRNLEVLPGLRIAQAWRVADWNPGVYSIVRFELTDQGPSTKILFDHTGFPTGLGEHLAEGWTANYWEPLRKYLA